MRLIRARKAGSLTKEKEAVLDKLPQARKMTYGHRNPETLVDEIIELGHMPTQSNNASSKEKKVMLVSELCTNDGLVDKRAGSSFGQASAGTQGEK